MRTRHTSRFWMSSFVVVVAIATFVTNATAADGSGIEVVKVEETWQLEVGEPNADRNAPQVTMVMSPHSHLSSDFFVFTVNHRNHPTYHAGGAQVARFHDETMENYRSGPKEGTLESDAETIRWTQVMTLASGEVTFDVTSGSSLTWGAFGGEGYLRDTVRTGQTNLNSYTPNISIGESEIGFAGNRVVSLTLMQIKWHLSDGRVYEKNAPIDIHTDLDPWNEE